LEVGKKADLIVLDQNLFEIKPTDIHRTTVLMTMIDGHKVYEFGDEFKNLWKSFIKYIDNILLYLYFVWFNKFSNNKHDIFSHKL